MIRALHPSGLTALISAACLTGCAPGEERSPAPTTSEASQVWPGDPVTSLEEIEGFWLVQSFGDFEPGWRNGTPWRRAYVQMTDEWLAYSIGCNHSGNPANLGDDAILKDTGDGSRMQTLMGCPPDWEDRDGRFFGFFGSNPKVTRPGEDWIILKSKAGELVLVKPDRYRRENAPDPAEIVGRWVPQMAQTYEGSGHSGFGIGEDPGVVTITRKEVTWSNCPEAPVRIEWTEDARLENRGSSGQGCRRVERSTENGPRAIMRMLAASPAVMQTSPHHIVLIDGDGAKGRELHLQSEQSVLNPPKLPPPPPGTRTPPPPPPPPPPPLPPSSD